MSDIEKMDSVVHFMEDPPPTSFTTFPEQKWGEVGGGGGGR